MTCLETVWNRLCGEYRLLEDEVHVWRTTLEKACIVELRAVLSQEEKARADRFYFEADRNRHIIGRGLLRTLLGHCLGTPADQLQFQYNEFGKPGLLPGCRPPVEFNLSHSGDRILVALALGRQLGIDVEQMRPDMAGDDIAGRFFSPNECRALATLKGEMRCAAFFACWTRKEAYLKARGDGLSLPLDQFDVSLLPGEEPRLLQTRHDPLDASLWTLRELDAGREYKAALAVEGRDWNLKCWDWSGAGTVSD